MRSWKSRGKDERFLVLKFNCDVNNLNWWWIDGGDLWILKGFLNGSFRSIRSISKPIGKNSLNNQFNQFLVTKFEPFEIFFFHSKNSRRSNKIYNKSWRESFFQFLSGFNNCCSIRCILHFEPFTSIQLRHLQASELISPNAKYLFVSIMYSNVYYF